MMYTILSYFIESQIVESVRARAYFKYICVYEASGMVFINRAFEMRFRFDLFSSV